MEKEYQKIGLYAVNVSLHGTATTLYIYNDEKKALKKMVELANKKPNDETAKVWFDFVPIEDCEIDR